VAEYDAATLGNGILRITAKTGGNSTLTLNGAGGEVGYIFVAVFARI
jgi:hypothetical protein